MNIIFDFDGTLVDTSEGIIKCMHYAGKCLKEIPLEDQQIKETIGPPLQEMIRSLFKTEDADKIQQGMKYFRLRYTEKGVMECSLYQDVEKMLKMLKEENHKLYIATSKPYDFVIAILKRFKLEAYFDYITGVNLKGKSLSKAQRIRELMMQFDLREAETLMVGDRQEDVEAARLNGIKTIGMLYGFGKKEDLEKEGCKHFCYNSLELMKYIDR